MADLNLNDELDQLEAIIGIPGTKPGITPAAAVAAAKTRPRASASPPPAAKKEVQAQRALPQGGIIDVQGALASFPVASLSNKEEIVYRTPHEITLIFDKLANFLSIGRITALNAICEMIRRGGANNNTPQSFTITIACPYVDAISEVEKRDVLRFAQKKTSKTLQIH